MEKVTHITLSGDQQTITIQDLVIEDARAHRLLSQEPDDKVERKLRDAISIGVLALDRTAAMAESDWVTQRLESQVAAVNLALERGAHETLEFVRGQFDSARAGSILAPMTDLIERTQREIAARLADTLLVAKDSHAAFQAALDPSRDGTLLKEFLVRFDRLAKESASSPALQTRFDELRDEFKNAIATFRVGADAAQAIEDVRDEMTDASPLKGLVFEDQVRAELCHIAEIRNDLVEIVGSQPGKGTSKRGDLVYFINQTQSKVVFELKDYSSCRFSFDKIRALMETCCSNRDAIYGVFLVKEQACLPDGIGRFFIGDDFIIATHEFLETALKISILLSHQKVARLGSGIGPDWMTIEGQIRDVKSIAEELSTLESGCATASRAISKTSDGIRRISRTLIERVEIMLAEAAKAVEPARSKRRKTR